MNKQNYSTGKKSKFIMKELLIRAKARAEKVQKKNEISLNSAKSRGDKKAELALSEGIEDYNTILWALEEVQRMADKKAQEYIFECPRCGYAQRFYNPSIEHHCPFHPEVKMRLIRVAETE